MHRRSVAQRSGARQPNSASLPARRRNCLSHIERDEVDQICLRANRDGLGSVCTVFGQGEELAHRDESVAIGLEPVNDLWHSGTRG